MFRWYSFICSMDSSFNYFFSNFTKDSLNCGENVFQYNAIDWILVLRKDCNWMKSNFTNPLSKAIEQKIELFRLDKHSNEQKKMKDPNVGPKSNWLIISIWWWRWVLRLWINVSLCVFDLLKKIIQHINSSCEKC